jgi:hypothetical protein
MSPYLPKKRKKRKKEKQVREFVTKRERERRTERA